MTRWGATSQILNFTSRPYLGRIKKLYSSGLTLHPCSLLWQLQTVPEWLVERLILELCSLGSKGPGFLSVHLALDTTHWIAAPEASPVQRYKPEKKIHKIFPHVKHGFPYKYFKIQHVVSTKDLK